jgi:deoxyribonuclease-4
MAQAAQHRLGRHLGIAMGMARALTRGIEAGYDAAQVFPGNPTGWRHVPMAPEAAQAIRAHAGGLDVAPLVIHAPYIINIASPDDELSAKSTQGLINSLARAGEIGARYVVVHAGSHKGAGEVAGLERVAGTVQRALATIPPEVELLIENSTGSGNILGGTVTALAQLLSVLPREVGTCIDTAHLWGSGVDLSSADGVEQAIDELERQLGLERVRVLHVNDSAVGLGSRRDVHAHLGEGGIGLAGLSAWLTHPALDGKPVIMETPEEDDAEREAARCTIARLLMAGEVAEAAACLATLRAAEPAAEETLTPDMNADGAESAEPLTQA